MAHEKSCRVLMFVEYALRLSADAISSVASTSAFRITSNLMGSIRVGVCNGATLLVKLDRAYLLVTAATLETRIVMA